MNKARRKELDSICDLILQARERLESVIDEEREALENMPESLQESERGQEMQDYIWRMEEAYEQIDGEALQEIADGW
jgi:hypothetical protein